MASMRARAGIYVGEITEEHRRPLPTMEYQGRKYALHIAPVQPGDVGKAVYLHGDVLQVENEQQRAERRADDHGHWECYRCGHHQEHLTSGFDSRCPVCGSHELHLSDEARRIIDPGYVPAVATTSGQAGWRADGRITIEFRHLDDQGELQRIHVDVTEYAEELARDLLVADVKRRASAEDEG